MTTPSKRHRRGLRGWGQRLMRLALAAGAALRLGLAGGSATAAPPPPPPNFVIILADDLGRADLGCYGARHNPTPRLDRMAHEGLRFTQAYSTPVCSPSRACLLSGQYAWRSGFTRVLHPEDTGGITTATTILSELLRARGYTSGLVGKWHLGHQPHHLPTRRGFDSFFGLPYSNNASRPGIPLPLMRGEQCIEQEPDQRFLTRRYTQEAQRFLRETQGRPFLLYLAHAMPHFPEHCSPEFAGRSGRDVLHDAIIELDWSTGEVLDTLNELGLATSTLVLFSSDNGPRLTGGDHERCGELSGGKASSYEGGVRIPLIAWWPSRIAPDRVTDGLVGLIDFLPTLSQLARAPLPRSSAIDGLDCSTWWLGAEAVQSPRRDFAYWSGPDLKAVRVGDYKLWLPGFEAGPDGALFDLAHDPAERHDLLSAEPLRAAALRNQARAWQAERRATPPAMTLPPPPAYILQAAPPLLRP